MDSIEELHLHEMREPNPLLATMYGRWTLDCVVKSAHAVALDFVNRPRNYRQVPQEIGLVLADFKARTGSDPDWPDTAQRSAIFSALFGSSDAKSGADRSSQFHQLAAAVRRTAMAYSERVYDTGEPMLRRAFIDAATAFQSYLITLGNGTLQIGGRQTGAIFGHALEVLTDHGVASVFGVPPAPGEGWPFEGDYGGDGGFLIEEITRMLTLDAPEPITQQRFVVLQRIARHGMSAIAEALQVNSLDEQGLLNLITDTYSWATALRDLEKYATMTRP